ncbi:ribosome biogenesis GTP-binding protein YihA/YsxC [Acetilactobacillus jinshanensis]|uniref:Probable GTP-binding protein EngB n=1 Tax=Acetilactobacillus jinshanensis TaxID=1720083 RepID=A0A4P6ZJW9_9LACO|nr:ribosome biogenesis GTP-binding protein YihA/YsxC [Acetilactobacillus jinshanensis]QBP17934.1 YihA family ribosome biogenesis GTP-binding protein [Acetilactobacillus jinshanensis]URL60797.1 YihA family ribosome biogenesis GTP-binding protein [uncultured bacterium]
MDTTDVKSVNLEISAVEPKQYPRKRYPEIAFVGRSNVGKSSLTDVLMNRKNYAHTSKQPGKTQTLNFYNVNDQLYLVDIPGYGYAKVPKEQRETWANMIDTYLTKRHELSGVILLVDGRRWPSKLDTQMKTWLNYYQIPTLVVATKMDKVKHSQWNREAKFVKNAMAINDSSLALFSASKKIGQHRIWQWITKVAKL